MKRKRERNIVKRKQEREIEKLKWQYREKLKPYVKIDSKTEENDDE